MNAALGAATRVVSAGGLRSAGRSALLRLHAAWRDRDPADALVLSCEPRGGSTWLNELLAAAEPSATIWEPLHPSRAPDAAALGFGARQLIPADSDWPEARALMARILSGRTLNGWTASASPARQFLTARRLIVKFCRANALLPWLTRQFAFRRKPVHFLRHPFAIAASQLQMGNFGTEKMDQGLIRGRFAELRAGDAAYIRELRSDAERIVALWCVANRPALEDPEAESRWVRAHYETLLMHPERELERIFAAWGASPPPAVLGQVRKASRMTRGGALKTDLSAQLGKWREVFEPEQVRAMRGVLDRFHVAVYGDDPYPR